MVRLAICFLFCVLAENVHCIPRNGKHHKKYGTSDKLLEMLVARIDLLEKTLASRDQTTKADIEQIRNEYMTELQKQRLDHQKEMSKLRREHRMEIAKLRQERKAEVDKVNRELKTEISKLRKQFQMNGHLLLQDVAKQTVRIEEVETELQKQYDIDRVVDTPVNKTASDLHRLETSAVTLQQEMQSESRIRQIEYDAEVAFYATLNVNSQHIGNNQIIVFEHVVTNIGNSYNQHTGTFIAPVPGTYVFSVTLTTLVHEVAHYAMFRNSAIVSRIYINGAENAYDTASQTAIFRLAKGDDITIKHLDADHALLGGTYSLFSGFLLRQDFSDSTSIVGK